jgi:hypothetical protein
MLCVKGSKSPKVEVENDFLKWNTGWQYSYIPYHSVEAGSLQIRALLFSTGRWWWHTSLAKCDVRQGGEDPGALGTWASSSISPCVFRIWLYFSIWSSVHSASVWDLESMAWFPRNSPKYPSKPNYIAFMTTHLLEPTLTRSFPKH